MDETTKTLTSTQEELGADGLRVWRLVVLHTPDADARGRSVILGKSPIFVGRPGHAEGALALDDGSISRSHVRVSMDHAGGVRIEDQGSRNGTFLNGERVDARRLESGDVVRMGGTLVLADEVSPESLALAPAQMTQLVGESLAMRRLAQAIREAARREDAVVILGESGAGKELVARAVHDLSGRGPFVDVNCGALPEQLMESELFGHTAGAFTGAQRAKPGLFEAADGGTLFLDEIGELSLDLQPKLLRALSTGEVRAVGATQGRRVSVRIVAATNRDLLEQVDADRFRGDLYARLARWILRVPALRDRREDILPLAQHFLARQGCTAPLDVKAAEALVLHTWRFNVRELENTIAVAATRAAGAAHVTAAHLEGLLQAPAVVASKADDAPVIRLPRGKRPPRELLEQALQDAEGNVAKVAALFDRERRQVYRWLEHYGIDLGAVRAADGPDTEPPPGPGIRE